MRKFGRLSRKLWVGLFLLLLAAPAPAEGPHEEATHAGRRSVPVTSRHSESCHGDIFDAFLRGDIGAIEAYSRIETRARQTGIRPEDCYAQEVKGRQPSEPQFRYLAAAFGKAGPSEVRADLPIPLSFKEYTYEILDGKSTTSTQILNWDGHMSGYEDWMKRYREAISHGAYSGEKEMRYIDLLSHLLQQQFLIRPSEGRALRSYVRNGYREINSAMRGLLAPEFPESGRKAILEDAEALHRLFSRLPGLPGKALVFRGAPLGKYLFS
jgi:hypothetical protein